jgi:hypothetical protein
VNEGPTCYTKKPYWGAANKACDIDQYGAPPMDGSKEDGQAGCTGKPYWGAAKKSCGVNQYGAPPMDGSNDSQAGAPATAGASKGLATPTTGQRGHSRWLRGREGRSEGGQRWFPRQCLRGCQRWL